MNAKLAPKSKVMLFVGLMNIALGLSNLLWPNHYDSSFDNYLKLLWFVYGATFIYRAYRPAIPKSLRV